MNSIVDTWERWIWRLFEFDGHTTGKKRGGKKPVGSGSTKRRRRPRRHGRDSDSSDDGQSSISSADVNADERNVIDRHVVVYHIAVILSCVFFFWTGIICSATPAMIKSDQILWWRCATSNMLAHFVVTPIVLNVVNEWSNLSIAIVTRGVKAVGVAAMVVCGCMVAAMSLGFSPINEIYVGCGASLLFIGNSKEWSKVSCFVCLGCIVIITALSNFISPLVAKRNHTLAELYLWQDLSLFAAYATLVRYHYLAMDAIQSLASFNDDDTTSVSEETTDQQRLSRYDKSILQRRLFEQGNLHTEAHVDDIAPPVEGESTRMNYVYGRINDDVTHSSHEKDEMEEGEDVHVASTVVSLDSGDFDNGNGSEYDLNHSQGLGLSLVDPVLRGAFHRRLGEFAAGRANDKAAYLVFMSRELREPLHAILGLTNSGLESVREILDHGVDDGGDDTEGGDSCDERKGDTARRLEIMESLGKSIESLKSYGTYMHSMVDDVLEMSRLESGRVKLESIPMDLHALLTQICSSATSTSISTSVSSSSTPLQTLQTTQNNHVDLSVSPEVPKWVRSDPFRISQALTNVLNHAKRFSKLDGSVKIVVRCVESLVFDVDVGNESERIDGPGSRSNTSSERIVYETIAIENNGGKRVRALMVPDLVTCGVCQVGVRPCTCYSSSNEHIRDCLVHRSTGSESRYGVSVGSDSINDDGDVCYCAATVVVEFRYAERDNDVFVDNNDDGDQVNDTQRRKDLLGSGLGLPITVSLLKLIGGSLQIESHVGRGNTISFRVPMVNDDAFLAAKGEGPRNGGNVKSSSGNSMSPGFPYDGFVRTVRASGVNVRLFEPYGAAPAPWHQDGSTSTEPSTMNTTSPVATGGRVLIVDDNQINLTILRRMLTRLLPDGIDVDEAHDGMEALAMLTGKNVADDGNSYMIVFMDIQMPIMDGIDVTSKARSFGVNVPIIAVTATGHELEDCDALNIGFDGIMVKPFTEDSVVFVLNHLGIVVA
ncbi:hypothetical protein HDU76_010037 [Blyttiomyces sp. JEL0837]|nr:hypothetical protein HDU76_010037 [Blyttiomyces sp. JEL0837]